LLYRVLGWLFIMTRYFCIWQTWSSGAKPSSDLVAFDALGHNAGILGLGLLSFIKSNFFNQPVITLHTFAAACNLFVVFPCLIYPVYLFRPIDDHVS
jgi:hypothetical protein